MIDAPSHLISGDVANGEFEIVLVDYTQERDVWLVWPASRMRLPRLRVFGDFVVNLFSAI